jgi:UDP-glucuronate 4-epimerase
MTPAPLTGAKILLTGVTGQVAGPLARNLVAAGNTVYGTSRFADADARSKVAADGVIPVAIDLETGSFDEIPDGLDYVINMAVAKSNNFDRDLAANAEGVALLIERVKGVKAFFHCSSCAVYEPNGHVSHVETDDLGDNHRAMGFMTTYSISKIAAESAVRYASKRFGVPAVIARLDVPYGPSHGWPQMMVTLAQMGIPTTISADAPNTHCFLHDRDILGPTSDLQLVRTGVGEYRRMDRRDDSTHRRGDSPRRERTVHSTKPRRPVEASWPRMEAHCRMARGIPRNGSDQLP